MKKVEVTLSDEQLARLEAAAKCYGVEPGDVMLALAFDRLEVEECTAYHDDYLRNLLWRFVHCRESDASKPWRAAGFRLPGEEEVAS